MLDLNHPAARHFQGLEIEPKRIVRLVDIARLDNGLEVVTFALVGSNEYRWNFRLLPEQWESGKHVERITMLMRMGLNDGFICEGCRQTLVDFDFHTRMTVPRCETCGRLYEPILDPGYVDAL
jgi:hypothetical protein